MPLSSMSSWSTSDADTKPYATSTLPRRVRHIASLQIRNLTPFPARDALASALTKPSEQPQFTPFGHLSDDLDVTLGKKRGRRISAASSIYSGHRGDSEDGISGSLDRSGEPTMRRRTSSRASIPLSTSAGSSSPNLTRHPSNIGATQGGRPTHRPRTLSLASSHSHQAASSTSAVSGDFGPSTSSFFPDLLRDTSQKNLEKILQTRLVETFVTITLLSGGSPGEHLTQAGASPSSSRPSSPSRPLKDKLAPKATTASHIISRRGTVGANGVPLRSPTTPTRSDASKGALVGHGKSASVSSSNRGKSSKSPLTPSPQKARFPASVSSQSTSASSPASDRSQHFQASRDFPSDAFPVPDYISPIHWPSTNPVFRLNRDEFAPGTDLSGAKMRVDVWGRAGPESLGSSILRSTDSLRHIPGRSGDTKGKGKATQLDHTAEESEWKVLQTWEVVLNELRPVPQELTRNTTHMPSNTLLITLSTGETLYLPPRSLRSRSQSRAPSPNAGYNSDPETDVQRVRGGGDIGLQSPKLDSGLDSMPTSPTISELGGTHRRKRTTKSASWQDLLKLINLQTVILDTEQSLGEIVRQIDKAVVHNEATILAREVSEREACLAERNAERSKVDMESESLRNRISARREDLQRRRELLVQARRLHEEDHAEHTQVEQTISEERTRLLSLRQLLPIMRSNLISIVAFIYPIELVSPPDLLFSILDVPLPIPVSATDPAPPLTLSAHKDVTEDSVATALGYSAQVVHLLSAYMGHRLVYPVTCVGSRSMIKDGISAMVGPRNFPLFSKGVDTYRFEYGVFLLNKDIEMLMGERNLRALDMRHTLPNLKNLLLTLTDNVQRSIPGHRVASSSLSISSLQSQSPVPATSSLPSDATNASTTSGAPPRDGAEGDPSASEPASARASTPPASGTSTPTATTQRKSRTFLDLAPLTGFLTLRGRYGGTASQKPTVKAATETPDEAQTPLPDANGVGPKSAGAGSEAPAPGGGTDDGDDEDDRRTIRGVQLKASGPVNGQLARVGHEEDGDGVAVEGKTAASAAGRGGRRDAKGSGGSKLDGREKVAEGAVDVARSPTPLVLSS
ncbi:hypothetical protein C8Q80DRAFT_1091818 [Daedaleopsis nitida]|nr:hypothetical protein C8Q80DRAFT_1091818 [Daedaleopsis nitida]